MKSVLKTTLKQISRHKNLFSSIKKNNSGSLDDRGIIAWREEPEDDGSLDEMVNDVYLHPLVRGHRYWKWMPFMPNSRAGVKIDKVGTEKDLELMEDDGLEKEAVAEVEEAVEEKAEDEKPEAGQSANNL